MGTGLGGQKRNMLYIKSISIPNVNPYKDIGFQGFNNRFYYMDTAWGRHSCPIEEVEYEAFFGQRYKKDTEIGYLVDETLANILHRLGQRDFDFMQKLYSDAEMHFEDGQVKFTYLQMFPNPDIQGFDYVSKTDSFPISETYHAYIKGLRESYEKSRQQYMQSNP